MVCLKISARNVLKGTITEVKEGAVNGIVVIDCGCCKPIKADITLDAIKDLGLEAGKEAYAIIKASNVMFAAGEDGFPNLSARNQLKGTVVKVVKGAVNGHVTVEHKGAKIKGSITNDAIDELGLKEGDPAVAIVKSTDVMVGID
ncbi:MAG: TOBE domain-containing protein [Eggerthellaceae bacterium]